MKIRIFFISCYVTFAFLNNFAHITAFTYIIDFQMERDYWSDVFQHLQIDAERSSSYALMFKQHEIDERTSRFLTMDLLKEMGIHPIGHRILIHQYLQKDLKEDYVFSVGEDDRHSDITPANLDIRTPNLDLERKINSRGSFSSGDQPLTPSSRQENSMSTFSISSDERAKLSIVS